MNTEDHVAIVEAMTLEQDKLATQWLRLLAIYTARMQAIEDVLQAIYAARRLNTATGYELRVLGERRGLVQPAGMSAARFRTYIFAAAMADNLSPTYEHAWAVWRSLWLDPSPGNSPPYLIIRPRSVEYQLDIGLLGDAAVTEEHRLAFTVLRRITPLGVTCSVLAYNRDEVGSGGGYFAFGEDTSPRAANFDQGTWPALLQG